MSKSVPITRTELEKINASLILATTTESLVCMSKSTMPLQQDGYFTHHHYTQDNGDTFKLVLVRKNTITTFSLIYLESDNLDLELFNSVVQNATSVLQRCGFRFKSKHSAAVKLIQASIMFETNTGGAMGWVVQDQQRTQTLCLENGFYEESNPGIFLTGCPNTLETIVGNTVVRLSRFFQIRNAKNQLYKDQGLAYSLVLAAKFFVPSHHFELAKEV